MVIVQALLPLVGAGIAIVVALMIMVFTLSKKYVDSELDYLKMNNDVQTKNLDVARIQLEWLGKDLTDPQSGYADHTSSIEPLAFKATVHVVRCFKRARQCRKAFAWARPSYELARWASLFTIFQALAIVGILLLKWPALVVYFLFATGAISILAALVSFIVAERCTQVIRSHNATSRSLDAQPRP